MKTLNIACLVAVLFAVTAGAAEAKGKPGGHTATSGGSTGGVATNYGCKVFPAGSSFTGASGATRLEASTNVCYVCDTTTRVCKVQSPSSLAGSTFSN